MYFKYSSIWNGHGKWVPYVLSLIPFRKGAVGRYFCNISDNTTYRNDPINFVAKIPFWKIYELDGFGPSDPYCNHLVRTKPSIT